MPKYQSGFATNENGEIVAVAGTGTNNVVAQCGSDTFPVDDQGRLLFSPHLFGGQGDFIVNDSSATAASANRIALQAMLDKAAPTSSNSLLVDISSPTQGFVYIDGPLYYNDNTTIRTAPSIALKQRDGTNNLMLASKQLLASWTNVSISWTAGDIATMTWTGHSLVQNDAVVIQGVSGTTLSDWFDVVRVTSVVDANTVTIILPFVPTAAPTGQMKAKRCHRNVNVDVSIDYNKTGNPLSSANNYARMGVVAAFVADSNFKVKGNDLYKYVLMVAGADNCQGSAKNGLIANSDTLKYYGPLNSCVFSAEGRAAEDCASFQALEPSAFINYMPCSGNIRNVKLKDVAAANTTGGSGPIVVYVDDTYTQEGLVVDGGDIKSYSNSTPAVAIKAGSGFTTTNAKCRDVTLRGLSLYSAGYPAVEVTTKLSELTLDAVRLSPSGSDTTRIVRIPNGAVMEQVTFRNMSINLGVWPATTGYFLEIGNGGIVNTVLFDRVTFRGSASLRGLVALSGCTVNNIIFDNCRGISIDAICRLEQAGITVTIRGGNYNGVLTIANFRASGTLVLEGQPRFTGATNGIVRAEISGTAVDMYATSMPVLSSSNLFVCLTSAVVNPKSQALQLNLSSTGVNKAAGNQCFSNTAVGTIPANRSVVCDGTNWYNIANTLQTY